MAACAMVLGAGLAGAQTTVTLSAPDSEVADTTIRDGSYASSNLDAEVLATRVGATDYNRRVLLQFAIAQAIPAGADITGAAVTVTVKGGNDSTRRVAAYGLKATFVEGQATWIQRAAVRAWTKAGGDLGTQAAVASITNTPGLRVMFDVTALVKAAHTSAAPAAIALVDIDPADRASYREYFNSESVDAGDRPTLSVTYAVAPPPAPTPTVITSTNVQLSAADTQVTDTTIRSGSYASTNLDADILVTRVDDALNIRRALLQFTTAGAVPVGVEITSAKIKVVVKGGYVSSRRVAAYGVNGSFIETQATWTERATAQAWTTPGADLGAQYGLIEGVTNKQGQKLEFDVTALVKTAHAAGVPSAVALVDIDPADKTSYREYYSSESATTSSRPTLSVTYNASAPAPESSPVPTPDPSLTTTLKALQYNIHHGVGTDGTYDIDRLANVIVKSGATLVSLNEVEKFTSWGNENQPARFAALLKQKTGKEWYYHFAQRHGAWTSNGQGNLVLSVFPFVATDQLKLPYSRSAALATVIVNGRTVTFISTHIDNASYTYRMAEINAILPWAATMPENRLILGDFNAGPTSTEVAKMLETYTETWREAKLLGTNISAPDNPNAITRTSQQIDYIFQSRQATTLKLLSTEVMDTRDANGIAPSDHKPVLSVFEIK
jgi:endonuclease/exonuclease/phosphatase family metal-dependent hydrolase